MALITAKSERRPVADAGEADQRIDAGERDGERHEIAQRCARRPAPPRSSRRTRSRRRSRAAAGRSRGRRRHSSPASVAPSPTISSSVRRSALEEEAPRPPPEREDDRRRGDPQPRDAERLDQREEQHREGRAEIVEDRADEEEGVRRHAVRAGRRKAALLRLSTCAHDLRQMSASTTWFQGNDRDATA